MGNAQPVSREQDDSPSPTVRPTKVLASNTGRCVEESTGLCLNLGAGKVKWDGWVSVDLSEHADVSTDLKKLPFPDNFADAIAAIHVLEHFHAWEAPEVLREWYRVLKPGGKLILELPCMDKVLEHIYLCIKHKAKLSPAMSWFVFWGDPKYRDPLMVHKFGYTKESLRVLVEACGFTGAEDKEPRYHFPVRDMRLEATK